MPERPRGAVALEPPVSRAEPADVFAGARRTEEENEQAYGRNGQPRPERVAHHRTSPRRPILWDVTFRLFMGSTFLVCPHRKPCAGRGETKNLGKARCSSGLGVQ